MGALLRAAARAVYGAYAWAALLAIVIPLCVVFALTPGLRRRRRAARAGARLFFIALGSPLKVHGPGLPDSTCVVVANHASYLDGIVLTAALPPSFTFLIKQEMAAVPIAGFVLSRLGSRFVDRKDATHRHRTVRSLVASAVGGEALALFPEGMIDPRPGLKAFQLGGFAAASKAGLPVVPAVIFGSRAMLPSNRLLPAPGAIEVRICEPLAPADFDSPRSLMRACRERILAHLGEPDLEAAAQLEAEPLPGDEPEPEREPGPEPDLTSPDNSARHPPRAAST
ncbi:MAG TPA: lysophospholipid acyltransferase family protein [Gammaproteobacteria bacterium]|nr:lysophospholipid acyltransferase family protein [Gammaproteobacteria bacterium]